MSIPRITAAICTHDDAPVIADAVRSVLEQSLASEDYAVCVINNASTDETSRILRDLAGSRAGSGPGLQVIDEPEPGLSVARNRALRVARSPLVAFLDADAIAEPAWLAGLVRAFETDARIAAAGGPVEIQWDHPRPRWWDERLAESLNAFRPSDRPGPMRYPRYPYGTNLALCAKTALAVGGFASELGRTRTSLAAAEEGELCLRLERAGWRIHYTPDAVVRHRTAGSRLTRRFVLRRAFSHGRSQGVVEAWHGLRSPQYLTWPRIVSSVLGHAVRGRCDLPYLKYIGFRVGYNFQRISSREQHRHHRAGADDLAPSAGKGPAAA